MSATPLTEHAEHAGTAAGTLGEPCVLLKLGEIVLKGGNRHQFERMLQANIRRALKETGIEIRFWQRDGVVVLRVAAGTSVRRRRPRPTR
jgi:adenylyl- and sulfurtransferase ThiI